MQNTVGRVMQIPSEYNIASSLFHVAKAGRSNLSFPALRKAAISKHRKLRKPLAILLASWNMAVRAIQKLAAKQKLPDRKGVSIDRMLGAMADEICSRT
ncbi:MAG: hypothetical protein PHP75_04120 [Methylacidiphilaceae bacterium]|nr:hypothetical protein [Candidatus Methylacidiphilaceae bacterium]